MSLIYVMCALAVIGIIGVFYWLFTIDSYIVRVKKNQVMEFKTSMDLSGLPIITFYQGKKKYNFLLDTGSNISYVNIKSDVEVEKTEVNETTEVKPNKEKPVKNFVSIIVGVMVFLAVTAIAIAIGIMGNS